MMTIEQTAPPVLFDDFKAGQPIGSHALEYDDTLVQRWQHIFGAGNDTLGGAAEAASVATILMMRAYLEVVSPRPPGNIHARQVIEFATLPKPGDRLTIHIDCSSKEMKRGRRYVELSARAENEGGVPIFQGVLTLIWAA